MFFMVLNNRQGKSESVALLTVSTVQWNLSKATTFGTKIIGCIRQVVLLCR